MASNEEVRFGDVADVVRYIAERAPGARPLPELTRGMDHGNDEIGEACRLWLDDEASEVWIAWRFTAAWDVVEEWPLPEHSTIDYSDWRVLRAASPDDLLDVVERLESVMDVGVYDCFGSGHAYSEWADYARHRAAVEEWQAVNLAELRARAGWNRETAAETHGRTCEPLGTAERAKAVDKLILWRIDEHREQLRRLRQLRARHLQVEFGDDPGTPGRPGSASRAAAVLDVDRSAISRLYSSVSAEWADLDQRVIDGLTTPPLP